MRKNLISFAVAAAIAFVPACLFGAPQVSSLAYLLVEKGYTPLTMKRAGNEFFVSCKLNGRSASLIVDTGAGRTVIAAPVLRSLGVPLTKGEENVYGVMGLAGKSKAGEINDVQIGPYQAGAHPVWAWDFSSWGRTAGGPGMDRSYPDKRTCRLPDPRYGRGSHYAQPTCDCRTQHASSFGNPSQRPAWSARHWQKCERH